MFDTIDRLTPSKLNLTPFAEANYSNSSKKNLIIEPTGFSINATESFLENLITPSKIFN